MDKAREEMEKKKADFKAGKSLVVSLAPAGVCVFVCVVVTKSTVCVSLHRLLWSLNEFYFHSNTGCNKITCICR